MIDLLKACSLLPYPTMEELAPKMVKFGPKTRQKTLILDMDETLLHSKFFPNFRDNIEGGLQNIGGVDQFNILL